MLYNLSHSGGKYTWATSIKDFIGQFGFNHVWAQQGVGNEGIFLDVFKLRVAEHFKSE